MDVSQLCENKKNSNRNSKKTLTNSFSTNKYNTEIREYKPSAKSSFSVNNRIQTAGNIKGSLAICPNKNYKVNKKLYNSHYGEIISDRAGSKISKDSKESKGKY